MSEDAYANFRVNTSSQDAVDRLSSAADEMMRRAEIVEQKEAELKAAQQAHRDIAEREIPELMDEMGLESFKTSSGVKITVKKTLRASISKARLAQVIAWLEKHGEGGMVKRNVLVAFNRDQEDDAKALLAKLRENFPDARQDASVNTSSVKAMLSERLARGEEVPLELFGAFEQRTAKIG